MVAHKILVTAQSPNSSFPFLFEFGLGPGTWTRAFQFNYQLICQMYWLLVSVNVTFQVKVSWSTSTDGDASKERKKWIYLLWWSVNFKPVPWALSFAVVLKVGGEKPQLLLVWEKANLIIFIPLTKVFWSLNIVYTMKVEKVLSLIRRVQIMKNLQRYIFNYEYLGLKLLSL